MSVLVLSTTTMSIEAFLAGSPSTTQPPFVTAWADNNGVAFTEGELDGALNSANPVTIVAAPASGTRRIVRSVIIYNADTAAITVTMRINNNGTYRILYKQTISPGDSFDWPSGIVAYGIDPTLYALTSYVDGKVLDSIADADTTHAPSRNSVYDALALKAPLNSPSFVTPALGTPVSGDFRNCSAPTATEKGVTVYSGSTKALAGTDTASAMTPADSAAAIAASANPKAMAQGVALTAGAAAAILNAHSTVYSNTTNSFGIGGDFILPTWTPAANQVLRNKWAANVGYKLEVVLTSGAFVLYLNEKTYTSAVPGGGAASNLVAGTRHKILAIPTVGASTTTVSFFLDGNLLSTTDAQANEDVTNTQDMYTGGTSAARYAMTVFDAYNFNRALTAAEVLDLYRNGIAKADKWGSQTEQVTGDDSDFDTVGNWTGSGATITGGYDSGDAGHATCLRIESGDGSTDRAELAVSNFAGGGITANEKHTIIFDYKWITKPTTNQVQLGGTNCANTMSAAVGAWASFNGTITTSDAATALRIYSSVSGTANDELLIDNLHVFRTGATLALEPEGIQPAPGQCLDSSSNKLHAMQPATGSSLTRYKKDFEYRWTNTWTASSAAQYVGGLNQAVLSADHFITDVITQATVTTDVENLTLGDGSDADRFVTAFAASATRTSQTIAAQNDGTNLKLVYTPAAEATMTVETIIRGFIWEP
jgi:hypothetical protein